MGGFCNSLKVYVWSELHVSCVDSQDFHSADFVGNTDVDFTVESASTTECGINRVWSVGCSDYNNLATALSAIHQRE